MTSRCLHLFATALVLSACSFDKGEHKDFCREQADCDDGEQCLRGFCVIGAGSGGADASADAASMDAAASCIETGMPEACYDGPQGSAEQGVCRSGEKLCVGGAYTQCLGQMTPQDEDCNQLDDDCDGRVDEIAEPGCSTGMEGVCLEGELTCRGAFAVCEPLRAPVDEICNGVDDDCDGDVDEVASSACYPMADGCTSGDDGVTCMGLCRAGMTRCQDGEQECRDAVLPESEECTSGGGDAADEDCDGQVDEGCPCTGDQTRPCYAGPAGTEGEGTCRGGTQACVGGVWGACQGQTLPVPESCQNQGGDDDCNGEPDDVEGLGEPCIDPDAQGQCRAGTVRCVGDAELPSCTGGEPTPEQCDPLDHNCDGDPYDGIDFGADEHCGECDNSCDGAEQCCEGDCRTPTFFAENNQHCGSCDNPCGAFEFCCQGRCVRTGIVVPGVFGNQGDMCRCEDECRAGRVCCFDTCVDLDNDPRNCGACGNRCSSDDISSEVLCRDGTCVP